MFSFPPPPPELQRTLARLRQEFVAGLVSRIGRIEAALEEIDGGAEGAFDRLYIEAHSLKGTAATFQADDLVAPATALSARARRWRDSGTATGEEMVEARAELDALRLAAQRYSKETR